MIGRWRIYQRMAKGGWIFMIDYTDYNDAIAWKGNQDHPENYRIVDTKTAPEGAVNA